MSLSWEEEKKKPYGRDYRALAGEKFGKLTVESVDISKDKPCNQRFVVCHCRCDCGNLKDTSAFNLLAKDPHGVRSCGCNLVGNKGHFKPLIVSEEELRRLYLDENLSVSQVSQRLSLSVGVVERHLKRYGIKKDIKEIVKNINRTKTENLIKNPKPIKIPSPPEWVVYKHTSPEGKSYIGQTKRIKNRWGKNGNWGYECCQKFQNAIDKFGWENFTHEILERGITNQEQALEREAFWINYYDAINNGYNNNEGGFRGPKKEKPIFQIEPDTLKIVNRFRSLREAVSKTGISAPCISQCCNRIIQTAGKYCWCYEQDFSDDWTMPTSSVRRGRRIRCIETGEIFHSPQELARKIGVTAGRITRVCGKNEKYKNQPIHGLHYCYLGEENSLAAFQNNNLRKNQIIKEFSQDASEVSKEKGRENNV